MDCIFITRSYCQSHIYRRFIINAAHFVVFLLLRFANDDSILYLDVPSSSPGDPVTVAQTCTERGGGLHSIRWFRDVTKIEEISTQSRATNEPFFIYQIRLAVFLRLPPDILLHSSSTDELLISHTRQLTIRDLKRIKDTWLVHLPVRMG